MIARAHQLSISQKAESGNNQAKCAQGYANSPDSAHTFSKSCTNRLTYKRRILLGYMSKLGPGKGGVYTCVWAYLQVHVYLCVDVLVCRSQRIKLSVFLNCFPHFNI